MRDESRPLAAMLEIGFCPTTIGFVLVVGSSIPQGMRKNINICLSYRAHKQDYGGGGGGRGGHSGRGTVEAKNIIPPKTRFGDIMKHRH